MGNNDIKSKTFSGLFWRFAERCGAQGVTFIVSIVLARILDPNTYGTVALITVLISILQVFIDSGLGNALIQKSDADHLDFSSVFFFNILMCTIIYIFLFISAPYIARFYSNSELTPAIRVLGLTLIIAGLKNIQQAYVSRNLLFKKFFFSTLGGTIGASIVGISLAYLGYGIWALVGQLLFNNLVDTIILWITVDWKPRLEFSLSRLKKLLSFGWKLLVSSLIDTIYNNLQQLIIGKWYSSSDLAFYNQGKQFPSVIVNNINTSIDSVLLPVISKEQNNQEIVKSMTRRAIKTSSYIMAPIMIGLACVASTLVSIILTDKWLECVFFLRVFCISYMFYPIHTANLNAIKAMGRSDLFLKLEIEKKIVGFIILIFTMRLGVEAMALGMLLNSLINQFINSFPNKKLLNYSYFDQIKDIIPNLLIAGIMGLIVLFVGTLISNIYISLIIQIIVGMGLYICLSFLTKNDSFSYLLKVIKNMFSFTR